MKIGMIGSGYVGLVTGSCFAHMGHTVVCVDHDAKKIASLNKGRIPIYEPGLSEMIKTNVKAGRLSFSVSTADAVAKCDVLFICVHTPPKPNGEADLTYVGNVAKEIAKHMNGYRLIVEKSTVPVETGEWIKTVVRKNIRKGVPFDVASNPEFLREGCAIQDLLNPDRIVIGVESERAETILKKIYAPLKSSVYTTDIRSAELIKHASNSFLALKITFANQLAQVCDAVGADVEQVAKGMGMDSRISPHFLRAGIGFGGSCFPKDLSAFYRIAQKNGVQFEMLNQALKVNESLAKYYVDKVRVALGSLKGERLAVLGLAFKPDTDDMREAPSLRIIPELQSFGAQVTAYDPEAVEKARPFFKKIKYAANPYLAAKDADAILILTEWSEFLNLDFDRLKKMVKKTILVDGRNMYSCEDMKIRGWHYISMGRAEVHAKGDRK
jgi:UDPglucose 6-dehydrogenase